jgi:hypothetical protein
MTDTAKKRLAIDLDEIERQLRQTAPQHSAPKNDPLAELARIVGQDDPFRAILSADRAGVEPRRSSGEADDIFALGPDPRQAAHTPYYERGHEHGHEHEHEHEHEHGAPYHETPHARPHSFDEFLDEADQPRYARPQQHEQHADDVYAPPEHARTAQPLDSDDYPRVQALHQTYGHEQGYGHEQEWREPEAYEDTAQYQYDESYDDASYGERDRPQARSRKGMLTVAAVLGVAILGVASALMFSGGGSGTVDGEPPLITAGSEPLKVAPQNPGGVEIPNQNRQIYGGASDEETQIVDREEQPVDIGEVARDAPRVVLPPPGGLQDRAENDPISQVLAGIDPTQGLQSPPNMSAAVAALGEPRRVRTVSVRPDGTIIGSPAAQQVAQAQPEPRTITDLMPAQPFQQEAAVPAEIPQVASDPVPPTPTQAAPVAPPVAQAAPAAAAPAPAPAPATPMSLTGATQPAVPQVAPEQVASIPAPADPAPAAQPQAQTGGYAVQLAIRESEERAYQAFSQYQTRYAGIIGTVDPIVRRAEVNGNTIYRIRIGPYALGEANTICERIKGAGGDCFVARN